MHYNTFDKENTSLGLSKIYQDPFKEATFISHEAMHIISRLLPYLFHSITEKSGNFRSWFPGGLWAEN